MRDLEIRGAGNLLGGEQSGHIAAVGFDLYCELVTEAVGELKGEKPVEPFEVVLDLPIDAHLPRDYVSRTTSGWRPTAGSRRWSTRPTSRHPREWQDRYGPIPAPAEALLGAARLRAECVRVRATSVSVQKGVARIVGLELPESRKVRLQRLYPKAVAKDDGELAVPIGVPPLEVADALVDLLAPARRLSRRAGPSRRRGIARIHGHR